MLHIRFTEPVTWISDAEYFQFQDSGEGKDLHMVVASYASDRPELYGPDVAAAAKTREAMYFHAPVDPDIKAVDLLLEEWVKFQSCISTHFIGMSAAEFAINREAYEEHPFSSFMALASANILMSDYGVGRLAADFNNARASGEEDDFASSVPGIDATRYVELYEALRNGVTAAARHSGGMLLSAR